jgi:hypothetical protein
VIKASSEFIAWLDGIDNPAAVANGWLGNIVPLQSGYVAHHVANLGRLYRA